VEQGGVGAGTAIRFRMVGRARAAPLAAGWRSPEPGRVLAERYDDTGAVTTFTVNGGGGSQVTITTAWSAEGFRGLVERLFAPFLRRVYVPSWRTARAAGGR
jgi:hypothetical protein